MAADAEPDEGKRLPHGKRPALLPKMTAFHAKRQPFGLSSIERGRRLLLEIEVDHPRRAEFRLEPRRLRRHDVARVGVDELLRQIQTG